jgi:hypothetical protein
MAQPKKIDKNEFQNHIPVEIRRVRNGYILSEWSSNGAVALSGDQLVFNKIEHLYAELKERFELKKE